MQKLLFLILFFILSLPAFSIQEDYMAPVPSPEDEVTTSGPDTKFSMATQMRYEAFKEAEINLPVDFIQDRKTVKLYTLSPDGTYMCRLKIPDAKVSEYTNGTFDIKFKDTADKIFKYDKEGNLIGFAVIKNKGKIPFVTYHYDVEGQILQIEIKPQYFRSYVYNLDGLLAEYRIDDKVYNASGKLIRRKKSIWF